MKKWYFVVLSMAFVFAGTGLADTFTHKEEGTVYHGYPKEGMRNGKNVVVTQEKGEIELNLNDYDIKYNAEGRNGTIAKLYIMGAIESDNVMQGFISSLEAAADGGYLMILIEIDSPGGRVDQCKMMVQAISNVTHTQVVAFLKGGDNGGAYSAGAVLSLSCDKIYMHPSTSMGAATMIAGNRSMKDVYGPDVGAKFDAAWRKYVAGVASKNGYFPALAEAMVTKEIVVLEVMRNGKKLYLQPDEMKKGDKVIREIDNKDEILTMTAKEAVEYGVCSGIYNTLEELLSSIGYSNTQVVQDERLDLAKEKYEKVSAKVEKILAKVGQYQQTLEMQMSSNPKAAMETIEKLLRSFNYLLKYQEKEKDVPVSSEKIREAIAQYQAYYDTLKTQRR